MRLERGQAATLVPVWDLPLYISGEDGASAVAANASHAGSMKHISTLLPGASQPKPLMTPENRKARCVQQVMEYVFRTLPADRARQLVTDYISGEAKAKLEFECMGEAMNAEERERSAA
jgi:hypothetical protein